MDENKVKQYDLRTIIDQLENSKLRLINAYVHTIRRDYIPDTLPIVETQPADKTAAATPDKEWLIAQISDPNFIKICCRYSSRRYAMFS